MSPPLLVISMIHIDHLDVCVSVWVDQCCARQPSVCLSVEQIFIDDVSGILPSSGDSHDTVQKVPEFISYRQMFVSMQSTEFSWFCKEGRWPYVMLTWREALRCTVSRCISVQVCREVPAKTVGYVPWVNLSRKNRTFPSSKLKSYCIKDKRIF